MARRLKRRLILLLLFALAVATLYPVLLRPAFHTALLAADLAGIELGRADIRPLASRQAIRYGTGEAAGEGADDRPQQQADLYLPAAGPGAGIVLVPGAAAGGRNDPRLVEFATSLARSRFAVLVPDITSLRQLKLSPGTAREIAAAVEQLGAREELPDGAALGIGALSVASGPAVLAAMDPSLPQSPDFLLLVGGYYDLQRTLTFMTTGYFMTASGVKQREPNAYGKWVYALSNADLLETATDREALSELARQKLEDPHAAAAALLERLSPAGRAVYEFVSNDKPERVPQLIAALPERVRRDIEALDLSGRDLSALAADVILIHGLDDNIIPYTESIALAGALPERQVELYLLEGLYHVDHEFGPADAWRLWRALSSLLSYRSG